MALYRCMSGGGTGLNVLYSALKIDTAANTYNFTQDYSKVYVFGASVRTAGSGINPTTQIATPTLSVGTINTIYDSGKVGNGRTILLELNNVKSGDSVSVPTVNSGLHDSMIIFTI